MSDNTWGRDDAENGAPDVSGLTHHNFKFHGSGKEFFGIWIVNVLLTIVTLGIYSAWAKVRTKRYFNGNTELAGHRFDYHAEPMQILKGRIVVFVVLIILGALQNLHPFAGLVVLAFYAIALPWVIVRGLAFNANMTSYRNVRFHFKGTKWEAFRSFLLWPLAAALTLGGLMPFASRANTRFLGNGHSFGKSRFSAEPPLKPYYKGLGLVLLLIAAPFILIIAAAGLGSPGPASLLQQSVVFAAVLIFYAALILAATIYGVYARNNSFGHLFLQNGHRFNSTMKVIPFAWIVVSNLILTLVTLTLFYPWARVRMAHYLADNTHMYAADSLDNFIDQQDASDGVASGEFLDIEGFDFGF